MLQAEEEVVRLVCQILSEEDAELVIKSLSVRKTRVLLAQVRKHYASFLGDEGEGSASATA